MTFRDGLNTAQIPSQYASFDQNGLPLNPQLSSQLFRPKTPSYNSSQQVRCLPVRMDPKLLPSAGFDLDVQNCHMRRPDGYLHAISSDMAGYAVAAKPVSILKVILQDGRNQYDDCSQYVAVQEYSEMLQNLQ